MENFIQNTIDIVVVKPRNLKYCSYTINENEEKAKTYLDLHKWLNELIPGKNEEIEEYLFTFTPFIVLVAERQIIKLSLDSDEEIENLRKKHKNDLLKCPTINNTPENMLQTKLNKLGMVTFACLDKK